MSMSERVLLDRWKSQVASGIHGLQLVDPSHPLEFFVGTDDMARLRLAIGSDIKPRLPSLSRLVRIDRQRTTHDRWFLSLTLEDDRFSEVFLRLAADLFSRSKDEPAQAAALHRISSALDEWQRLLRPRGLGLLTAEELQGLVGELWLVLNRFHTNERAIDAAIQSWVGPLNAPQDFVFDGATFVEAKAIGPSASFFKVASENQLDVTDGTLSLIVLTLPTVAEGTVGAVSLITLVAEVRSRLDAVAAGHEDLQLRLDYQGVDLDERFYADTWFLPTQEAVFEVRADFPAIRASQLPDGVEHVRYSVALSAIEPFRTSLNELN